MSGIDPDRELITATTVSAGNAGDAGPAADLLADLLDTGAARADHDTGED